MIVSFSLSNFKSFSSEETFSMVASKKLNAKHKNHTIPIPGSKERVLRSAVIYGANGAGKSNLFKALGFLRSIALSSGERRTGTGRDPFRLGDDQKQPSTFDLLFIANDMLYRYGVVLDEKAITEEWLVKVAGNKETPLFERITDPKGKVTVEAKGLIQAGEKLQALALVGGRPNRSFLANIRANLNDDEIGEEISSILNWFHRELVMIAPDTSFAPLGPMLARDQKFLKFAGELLNAASTGVDRLVTEKKEISEDELFSALPAEIADKVREDLQNERASSVSININDEADLLIEMDEENRFYRISVQAAHKTIHGKTVKLDLSRESDGTRRLLNLVPALHHLKSNNAVYFIDEVDRSMHPMLVKKFLEYFLTTCEGGNRQLIVTTHESNLLTLDLLRRDEIWFAEKDSSGATRIYSMSDFKVRNDLEIQKHYLLGRFGAIPFLGDIDQFIQEEGSSN